MSRRRKRRSQWEEDLLTLRSRLERAIDGLPEGSHITLPIAAVREWLDQEQSLEPDDALVDMTVVDVAERLGRSPSTVRGWCGSGALSGAYRFRGREWRIPPAALKAFLDREAEVRRDRRNEDRGASEQVDLGSWRRIKS